MKADARSTTMAVGRGISNMLSSTTSSSPSEVLPFPNVPEVPAPQPTRSPTSFFLASTARVTMRTRVAAFAPTLPLLTSGPRPTSLLLLEGYATAFLHSPPLSCARLFFDMSSPSFILGSGSSATAHSSAAANASAASSSLPSLQASSFRHGSGVITPATSSPAYHHTPQKVESSPSRDPFAPQSLCGPEPDNTALSSSGQVDVSQLVLLYKKLSGSGRVVAELLYKVVLRRRQEEEGREQGEEGPVVVYFEPVEQTVVEQRGRQCRELLEETRRFVATTYTILPGKEWGCLSLVSTAFGQEEVLQLTRPRRRQPPANPPSPLSSPPSP